MADIFRQPLVIPRARQTDPQQPDIPRNLLLTTLAVVVAAPFVNLDQPNPTVRPRAAQQPSHFRSSFDPGAPIGVAAPIVGTEQSPPKVRIRAAQAETSLGRLPNFPSMRIPGSAELPQPSRTIRAAPAEIAPNLLTSTLAPPPPPAAAPFKPAEQPNPTLRLRMALQPNHFRSSYNPGAPAAQPLPPGRLLDQPNPLQIRHMRGQEFVSVSYAQRPIEFLLLPRHDFPNPTIARRVQQPHVYPNLTLSTLRIPPQAMPVGLQRDFPNPLPIKLRDVHFQFDGTPLPNEIPPPVVPPAPTPSAYVGGGGMGGGKAKWWDEDKPKRKRQKQPFADYAKDVRQAFVEPTIIRDVYEELRKLDTAPPDVAAFTAEDGATDWNAAARDPQTVATILQAWRAEERRREIADDDEEMMLF